MPSRTKTNEAALATKFAEATQKHLSTFPRLVVDGSTLTPAEIEAKLLAYAALRADVEATRALLQTKLADEQTKRPALRRFFRAFEGILRAAFESSPDVLADFGLAPRKTPRPLTADEQLVATAKRAATRKARRTMGKRKRLAVKGDVTGVVLTPVTAVAIEGTTPPDASQSSRG